MSAKSISSGFSAHVPRIHLPKITILSICVLHIFVVPSQNANVTNITTDKLAKIEQCMRLAQEKFGVPALGVGIVVKDKVVFAKGYGKLDDANHSPVNEHTVFAICSCTKAFTVFILGQLVDEGRLNWDDPVADHIPEFRLIDSCRTYQTTVRDLITHRTGYPRHDLVAYLATYPRDELIRRLRYLEPNLGLRQQFQYCNIMFVVAGVVSERITGQKWEDLVRNRIFRPLGMTNSSCSLKEIPAHQSNFAMPYTQKNGKIVRTPWADISVDGPAGSIVSNIANMMTWVRVQLRTAGKNLIQEDTLKEMHIIQMAIQNVPNQGYIGYGFAWYIQFIQGHYMVQHGGNINGYIASVALFPEEEIGIVTLSNYDYTPFIDVTNPQIFNILQGYPAPSAEEWVAGIEKAQNQTEGWVVAENDTFSKPVSHPEQYVGQFYNPGYSFVEVLLSGSQLTLYYNRQNYTMKPKAARDFFGLKSINYSRLLEYECSYLRDFRGDVYALLCVFEPAVSSIYFEKEVPSQFKNLKYLRKFVGTYTNAITVKITMDAKNHTLTASVFGQYSNNLKPRELNIFYVENLFNIFYEFIISNGSASKLNLHKSGVVYTLDVKK